MLPQKKSVIPKRQLGNAKITSVSPYNNGTAYQITFEWYIRLLVKESIFCSFDTNDPDDKKRLEKLCSYAEVSDPFLLIGKLFRLVYHRSTVNPRVYNPELIGHIFENDFFNVAGLKFESNCLELI